MITKKQEIEININGDSGLDNLYYFLQFPIQFVLDECVVTQTLRFNVEELITLYLIIESFLSKNYKEIEKHLDWQHEVHQYDEIKKIADLLAENLQNTDDEKLINFRKILKPLLTTKI